jgi:hypothetical protein
VLAVIATEIAVLAASNAPADQAAAQAIERALGERVAHRQPVAAVRTSAFAPLGEARKLVAQARKQDLEVDFDGAAASLAKAIEIFGTQLAMYGAGAREELADAYFLRGIVAIHANRDWRSSFAFARKLDPRREVTTFEVHPDVAEKYRQPIRDFIIDDSQPRAPVSPTKPDEMCDLLWCDGVIVVGVWEQKGRASLVGTRYDANARAFTERVVAGNARDLIDALSRSPAFAQAQPSLVLPPEPPPPKIWQRSWFWTAVGGAAAALAGSLIYADATREVKTNVNIPGGAFGGH